MKILFIFFASLLLFSCSKESELEKELNCNISNDKNLETVVDVKNLFSVQIPENWKINLYQDEIQSSIFAADTTKQLTKSVLIDVTFINQKITLNDDFLLKQEQENLENNLIRTDFKETSLLKKPAYYMLYKGKKGAFNYQTSNIFIKINEENFLLAKTEVYGDSLINERFCNAISLLKNIKIHQ